MSLHCMATGTLTSDPVRRTSQINRLYVTATLRVPCDGAEPFLASLIAFSKTPAEALAEHQKGDTLVVGGRGNLKVWTGRDGQEHRGLGIVVEQVMSEYQLGKRRNNTAFACRDSENESERRGRKAAD